MKSRIPSLAGKLSDRAIKCLASEIGLDECPEADASESEWKKYAVNSGEGYLSRIPALGSVTLQEIRTWANIPPREEFRTLDAIVFDLRSEGHDWQVILDSDAIKARQFKAYSGPLNIGRLKTAYNRQCDTRGIQRSKVRLREHLISAASILRSAGWREEDVLAVLRLRRWPE